MYKNNIKKFDVQKIYVANLEEKVKATQENLVQFQSEKNKISTIISSYEIYKENVDIYKKYKLITDSNQKKSYYLRYKKQIQNFQRSKEILIKNFPNKVIPSYENLIDNLQKLDTKIYSEMEKFKQLQEEFKDAKIALKNMNIILNSDLKTQVKIRIQTGQTAKFNLKDEIKEKIKIEMETKSTIKKDIKNNIDKSKM